MGKTKTAFVSGSEDGEKKSSYDKAAKEAKRKAKQAKEKPVKVHIAGLKGGQRIKVIEAEPFGSAQGKPVTSPPTSEEERPVAAGEQKSIKKVKVRCQKYKVSKAKVDKSKLYSLHEAISLAKATSYSKFDATLELHLVVNKSGL